MNYIDSYNELLTSIKESKLTYEIKMTLDKIYNNKDLLNKIDKYNISKDNSLRKDIYNNKDYIKYKQLENELNLLILKLNKIFKELDEVEYENN